MSTKNENKYEMVRNDFAAKELSKKLGVTIYRIKALKDIPEYDVKAGDLGGFIQYEGNLSQYDNCWIADNAIVRGAAEVDHSAYICNNAQVLEYAKVTDGAQIRDNAIVDGEAKIFEDAEVGGNAHIGGNAGIFNSAKVYNAFVCGQVGIYKHAQVFGSGIIRDNVKIYGNSILRNFSEIRDSVEIYDDAILDGEQIYCSQYARIHGDAQLYNCAYVSAGSEIFNGAILNDTRDCAYFILPTYNLVKVTVYKTKTGLKAIINNHNCDFDELKDYIGNHYIRVYEHLKEVINQLMLSTDEDK